MRNATDTQARWQNIGQSPDGQWVFYQTAAIEDGVSIAPAGHGFMRTIAGHDMRISNERGGEVISLDVIDAGVEKSLQVSASTALYIAARFGLRMAGYQVGSAGEPNPACTELRADQIETLRAALMETSVRVSNRLDRTKADTTSPADIITQTQGDVDALFDLTELLNRAARVFVDLTEETTKS